MQNKVQRTHRALRSMRCCIHGSCSSSSFCCSDNRTFQGSMQNCKVTNYESITDSSMPEARAASGVKTITVQRQHMALHMISSTMLTWQLPSGLTLRFHCNIANSQNRNQYQTHLCLKPAASGVRYIHIYID